MRGALRRATGSATSSCTTTSETRPHGRAPRSPRPGSGSTGTNGCPPGSRAACRDRCRARRSGMRSRPGRSCAAAPVFAPESGAILARPGPLAQLVEQGTLNPKVEGSNPSRPTRAASCPAQPDQWKGSGETGRFPRRALPTRPTQNRASDLPHRPGPRVRLSGRDAEEPDRESDERGDAHDPDRQPERRVGDRELLQQDDDPEPEHRAEERSRDR